jgi:hypothetical protein
MNIELTEDSVATIMNAMRVAVQHEKEAVATGQVDVFAIGKIEAVMKKIEAQVLIGLRSQFATRLEAMGFKPEECDYEQRT